ncbi:MAG: polymer-forming cytoskeletal protein [Halioglobus sp.]
MLGNRKAGFGGGSDTTLVSRDTVVVGDIHFGGALDIEGTVQGNIIAKPGTDAVVRVIDKGCVEGEIRAPEVIINGRVEGNVYSSKHLELAAKACVQGDVFYTLVEMAVGSEVNGSLQHVVEASSEGAQSPDKAIPIAEAKQGKNRAR